jgi:cyclic phosphodiesterase-like protein
LFVIRQAVIAYWLIPAEPAHSFFQTIIHDLARRYDAPVFEPHVTLYVGADRVDSAMQALAESARQSTPTNLTPVGVQQSDEFVKTLFVQFASSAELRQLNEMVRNTAHDLSQYRLEPHLSLLYKKMEVAVRRQLAASIVVPFSQITFDRIKAVRCVSPTQSRADVESWRVVAAAGLLSCREDSV